MKNFAPWHYLKSQLEAGQISDLLYFYEREVWWCALGLNIGCEQDGKHEKFSRPILILRKFSKDAFWALPLTRNNKGGIYYYSTVHEGTESSVILSQVRLISSKRLLRKIRTLPKEEFQAVQDRIRGLI